MKVTFDTNIFLTREIEELPASFYLSAVVLSELLAGAADEADIKRLTTFRKIYEKRDRILVPVLEDWSIVGITLNNLQRARRDRKTKQIPKISVEERMRITNDVLIARTAKRENVTVVTDNSGDFEKIRNYCAVQIMSGTEYFGE